MARRIVRHEEILDGRWHFEGTRIPIAAIRADASAGVDDLVDIYLSAGLTEAEILLALNFSFPVLREAELRTQYATVTVACACGEATHSTLSGFDLAEVGCVCGRRWCLRLMLYPAQ